MRPYLTLGGLTRRARFVTPADISNVETRRGAGWVLEQGLMIQEDLESRLHKRYVLPFAQTLSPPSADGTTPPPISFGAPPLYGSPVAGDLLMVLQFVVGGPTGTAIFNWSKDGGQIWTENASTAPAVLLPGTGLTVLFPPVGTFSADNRYTSATPCPRKVLDWLCTQLEVRVLLARGVNPTNDQAMQQAFAAAELVDKEIREAADSVNGLFDLPLNADSAVTAIAAPSPVGGGQASPYAWMDQQRAQGQLEDACAPSPVGGSCP